MIEINLLPDEMRRSEGPPPARIGAWAGGALLLGAGIFLVIYFKIVLIPKKNNEIAIQNEEIKELKKRKDLMDQVNARMADIQTKLDTLTNLMADRIQYSRLMDTLCNAVNRVPNAWFKSFTIGADSSPGTGPGPHGKRYMLSLTGFATGNTDLEMTQKLRDLMNSMSYYFREREDQVDDKGFNKFLGATFDKPKLLTKTMMSTMPAPTDVKDPRQLKTVVLPKQGLDFSMTLSFELAVKQP